MWKMDLVYSFGTIVSMSQTDNDIKIDILFICMRVSVCVVVAFICGSVITPDIPAFSNFILEFYLLILSFFF